MKKKTCVCQAGGWVGGGAEGGQKRGAIGVVFYDMDTLAQ